MESWGQVQFKFYFLLTVSSDSGDLVQKPDVTQVMKELMRCQSQVKHLTAVLRESESNCERLAQLSEALKEEIRRVERDKERKEHLQENSEYLKNVLLKVIPVSVKFAWTFLSLSLFLEYDF